MMKILLLGLTTIIGYNWILFFRFCHPYPKSEFFFVIWIQFGIVFVSYLFSSKWGRIISVICGLTMVRFGPIMGMQSPIITLMGVFLGGVVGNLVREIISSYQKRNIGTMEEDNSIFFFLSSSNIVLILFLLILTLDRFLLYFNAPYLKGFGILETMYIPGVSSKEAFALSMESICNLLFPLLYFYSEEIRAKDKREILKDWKLGVFLGLAIQFSIILLQILWNRNFLAENTNLSLEANRAMGLFRDSGSSTWIFPILCFLFYKDLLAKERKFYLILIALLILQVFIGPSQGRGFWLIFFFGLFSLGVMVWIQYKDKLPKHSVFMGIMAFLLVVIILYQIPRTPNSSFNRLLSIPVKAFSFLQEGKNPIIEIDPHRYYFNLAAWKLFLQEPFFGNGIGSIIVNLKDADLHLFTPENKIDNPSFFLGALSEFGILGLILIILYSLISFQSMRNFPFLFLLFPTFSIGYHIVHPDGAFVVILVCLLGFGIGQSNSKYTFRVNTIGTFIALVILSHSMIQVFKQEKVPDFRKKKLNSYQLLAYEQNKKIGDNEYHVFKGKTIWVLKKIKNITLDAFLDESTSKTYLKQRWSILDKNRMLILKLETIIHKQSSNSNTIIIPENAYYLQVEELNEKGETKTYGDTPFCVPTIHFTKKNRYY